MKNRIQSKVVCVSGTILLAIALVVGCSLFEPKPTQTPTAPVNPEAGYAANFFAIAPTSELFEWRSGQNVFCVNILEAGDYLLTYTTTLGTFHVAFRALEPALIYVGLLDEDELLVNPLLQRGHVTINLDAFLNGALMQTTSPGLESTPINDGRVIRVATPADPNVHWSSVFAIDWNAAAIDLPKAAGTCPLPPSAAPIAPVAPTIPVIPGVDCTACETDCGGELGCMADTCPTCVTCDYCETQCEGDAACMAEFCPLCEPPVDCAACEDNCNGDLGCMTDACPTCVTCDYCEMRCEGGAACMEEFCPLCEPPGDCDFCLIYLCGYESSCIAETCPDCQL